MSSTTIPLRIHPGHVAFSEALVGTLSVDQKIAVHGPIKRAYVLREAILRGLIELEKRLDISGDTATANPKKNPLRYQRSRGRKGPIEHLSISTPSWLCARLQIVALEICRRAQPFPADFKSRITRCWATRITVYLGLRSLALEYGVRSYLSRPEELKQLKEILGGDLASELEREQADLRSRLQEIDQEMQRLGEKRPKRGGVRRVAKGGKGNLKAPWHPSRLL